MRAMIQFNDETGEIVLDFPDGPITVKPPKYGQLKRIRAEREAITTWARTQVLALPPIPEPADVSKIKDQAKQDQALNDDTEMRSRMGRERVERISQINEATLERWWRFVLEGDDSFAGLGSPKPPADPDDWPAELLLDHRELQALPIVDRVLAHWGKARFRSGPKA